MMDYSKGWHEGMTAEEEKNLAYYERNMAVLYLANYSNRVWNDTITYEISKGVDISKATKGGQPSGWYLDNRSEMAGWSRVISVHHGKFTVHVPDDFHMGTLPQIDNNWDNHSTEEKWKRVKQYCGIYYNI